MEAAQARGVLSRPLSRYYRRGDGRRGLLLGYACVEEANIEPAFRVLLDCIRP
jgi:GntR family transcriptional regulator / MocR family aminotransferase